MKQCSKCKIKKPLVEFYHRKPPYKYPSDEYQSWCRDCIKLKDRKRYWDNRKTELEKRKKWAKENPEKVKESRRKTQWKIKNDVIGHYGKKCICCGEKEIKFLCIDHINNDGNTQRKDGKYTGGTASFYFWIKKNNYPKDLQVLCYNCNMAKSLYKICPHKLHTN